MKDIIIGGLEGIHNGTHRAWWHRPQLILVGHNLVNDMTILDRLRIIQHFDLIGVADTQVLVQDTGNKRLPQVLSNLIL